MSRAYQVTGVVFLAFSAFIAWEALKLNYYTSLGPGPGFFPFWLATIFGLLSAIMLFQAIRNDLGPLPEGFFATRAGYLRIGGILVVLVLGVILMERLGFRLTMLGFLMSLMYVLGRPNPLVSVPVALLGSFGTYYIFVELLDVPLPIGGFGF